MFGTRPWVFWVGIWGRGVKVGELRGGCFWVGKFGGWKMRVGCLWVGYQALRIRDWNLDCWDRDMRARVWEVGLIIGD